MGPWKNACSCGCWRSSTLAKGSALVATSSRRSLPRSSAPKPQGRQGVVVQRAQFGPRRGPRQRGRSTGRGSQFSCRSLPGFWRDPQPRSLLAALGIRQRRVVQRLAYIAMPQLIAHEDRVVVGILEHGRGGTMAEQMWPGGCTHFDEHPVTSLGFQSVHARGSRGGSDDRVGVLAGDRPEAIIAAEAMLDGVAHQLVQQLRARAEIHRPRYVPATLFDGQDDVTVAEPSWRQFEHLADPGAGLGQRAHQELIAVGRSRRGDVGHLLAREEQAAVRDALTSSGRLTRAAGDDRGRDLADQGGLAGHAVSLPERCATVRLWRTGRVQPRRCRRDWHLTRNGWRDGKRRRVDRRVLRSTPSSASRIRGVAYLKRGGGAVPRALCRAFAESWARDQRRGRRRLRTGDHGSDRPPLDRRHYIARRTRSLVPTLLD